MSNDGKKPEVQPGLPLSHIAATKVVERRSLSASNLRQLTFGFMPDGFSITDSTGVHIDVNPAFCAMTGFSREELIGSSSEQLFWPPGEHEQIRSAVSDALKVGADHVELTFMRKDGEHFPVIINPFVITDASGMIIGFAASVKDITRRVKLQASLRDSEARYRALFERAADAIVILQGEKLIDCNQRALELFGLASVEQLASVASIDFFPQLQPDGQNSRAFSVEKLKAARTGAPQFFSWRHVKIDGSVFDAEVSLNTFKHSNETFIQAIIRDITQRTQLERALQDNELRYRTLFEHSGEAISIIKDFQIVDCNERLPRIYGYSREEILSNSTAGYLLPRQPNGQDSLEFLAERVEASRAGTPQNYEWHGVRSDGTPVVLDITLTSFKLGDEIFEQASTRDITLRKQLEQSLLNSELRYRTLFESAGDSIVIMKGTQIIDYNARTLELYGHSPEEILHNPATFHFPPTQPNGRDSIEFFGEMLEASSSGVPQAFEWTGRRSDGTTFCTEVTLTTFTLDGELYSQSIGRDVTQRKRLERALQESELRYRTLFESAADGISIMKGEQIIDCNRRATEIYGVARDELLSVPSGTLFPHSRPTGKSAQELYDEMVAASRAGIPQVYEWHGSKPDGTKVVTEISMTTFVVGGTYYEQAISRDITQRKQMEEALVELNATLEARVQLRTEQLEKTNAQLLQRTGELRAMAAQLILAEHEERKRISRFLHDNQQQLLVAAKFRAEMLLSDSYDSNINSAARNLVGILEQAVDISRSLTMELAPPVLYGSGLVEAVRWLARWMEENHHLKVAVIGTLPLSLLPTDLSMLVFQAVRELLLNVVKHSGLKQCSVTLSMAEQQLLVLVADEGVGFDVDAALESPRSLGLFGIQERLGLLGGRLTIISVPGKGTASTLSVPVTDPHLSLAAPAELESSRAQTDVQ